MQDEFAYGDTAAMGGDPTVADFEYVEDGVVITLTDDTVVGGYDTNEDDVVDITLVDERGDGTVDMIIDDVDFDGHIDTVYVAGATIAVDEVSGEILGVNETGTTEATYDPSTIPIGGDAGVGAGTETVNMDDPGVSTLPEGTLVSEYDTNADGEGDITLVDELGDGSVDAIVDDADYDGQDDTVYVAGATMTIDETTGAILAVNETGTTEATYDPSTVPGNGPVDYGPHTRNA